MTPGDLLNAFYNALIALLSLRLYIILVVVVVVLVVCFSREIYECIKFACKLFAYKIARRRVPLDVVCEEIKDALFATYRTRSLAQIARDVHLGEKKVWQALLILIDKGYVTVHDDFHGPALESYTLDRKAQLYFKLSIQLHYCIAENMDEEEVFGKLQYTVD